MTKAAAPITAAMIAGALIAAALIPAAAVGATAVLGAEAKAADAPFYATTFEKRPTAEALTALGRKLFVDPALSASGKMACATCHAPDRSFGPPNDRPVQRGGADGRRYGVRAVPSLMYAQNVPPFTEHYFDDEGDDGIDQGPAGGRNWDGRAQSAHEQARLPLFSRFEMANTDADALIARLERSSNAAEFAAVFGDDIFPDKALALTGVLMALEAYQQSPSEFFPYRSRYDQWLRGEKRLSGQELKGLAAFNDPQRGNCARCHPSAKRQGAFPQFTDFGYAALGVPRNFRIPANEDRGYFDLGLCGPLRTDLKARKEYCGLFRTPSLRNVAKRSVFFHNGVLHSLTDVVRFYAGRDTHPENWYPRSAGGGVLKFDDLPEAYAANIDREAPFGLKPGQADALSRDDIADIVAFLKTLSDE